MSIVIAVLSVLVVATLIARYYPHPKPANTLAEGKTLNPETEVVTKTNTEVIIEPVVEATKKMKKVDTTTPKPKKPKTQVTKKQIKNG